MKRLFYILIILYSWNLYGDSYGATFSNFQVDSIPEIIYQLDTICVFDPDLYIETCAMIKMHGLNIFEFAGNQLSGDGQYKIDTIIGDSNEILIIEKVYLPHGISQFIKEGKPEIQDLTKKLISRETLYKRAKPKSDKIRIDFENFHSGFRLIINAEIENEELRLFWIKPKSKFIELNTSFLKKGKNMLTRDDNNSKIIVEVI